MQTKQASASHRSFWLGKLFSLFGLIPIGVYVMIHLFHNLNSLMGEERFNAHLLESRSTPGIVPLAILVIWLPIAFHGLYGLFGMRSSRPHFRKTPYFGTLKYILQRLSGLGLLLFIPAHIYKTRIEPGLWNSTLDFQHMVEGMHEPLTCTIYIFGILGVAYHLANGIWQASIGWGVATSTRGMKRVQCFSYFIFAVVTLMGFGGIWGLLKAH